MLRFGISRSHGGTTLLSGARVFADELGQRMGSCARPNVVSEANESMSPCAKRRAGCDDLPVKLVIASDYEHLMSGMASGGVDVAWMPPLAHGRAVREGALLAAVSQRDGSVTYRSALLTRVDGPFLNDRSLQGARAAWSDPNSTSGYLFARLHLLAVGIDPDKDLSGSAFYGSPALACAAVADGKADFCACFVSDAAGQDAGRALADVERIYPAATWRLRVLAVTDSIPPDGIVLGRHVDLELQARVRDVLLSFHDSERGVAGLRGLMQADRLVAVTEPVTRILKRLDQFLR